VRIRNGFADEDRLLWVYPRFTVRDSSSDPWPIEHRPKDEPSDRHNQLLNGLIIVAQRVDKNCVGKPGHPDVLTYLSLCFSGHFGRKAASVNRLLKRAHGPSDGIVYHFVERVTLEKVFETKDVANRD
jgi:hypothetical protein